MCVCVCVCVCVFAFFLYKWLTICINMCVSGYFSILNGSKIDTRSTLYGKPPKKVISLVGNDINNQSPVAILRGRRQTRNLVLSPFRQSRQELPRGVDNEKWTF